MPTLRVWVKKTVPGPNGPIEIGLGGTHNITCEPHQLARERLALYEHYKSEVDRLIACELNGTPTTLPAPASHRPGEAKGSGADGASRDGHGTRTGSDPGARTEPGHEREAVAGEGPGLEPEPYTPVSIERSRQVLADLQERLAEKGRQREHSALGRSLDELLDTHRKGS